jgi:hypothetical protein
MDHQDARLPERPGAQRPAVRTVHRTASFKLHHPSKRKRDIIEYAFTEYTVAYLSRLLLSSGENSEHV